MLLVTLQRSGNQLADPRNQREILGSYDRTQSVTFEATIAAVGVSPLQALSLDTLQVNVGKVCNQTCTHCHVDAGPERRESMDRATAEQVIDFLRRSTIGTLDITGGAPEMNPNFRYLVQQATALGRQVIDRCNLTILLAPGFTDLAPFLAQHRVGIIASLPCYLEQNCDAQRGAGVFQKSITAIQQLNQLGYAIADTGLELHLVYNPVGTGLPPSQADLEQDYKVQLRTRYGIEFNRLFAITNMPISRFLDDLLRQGKYESYMQQLISHFNPDTIPGLMCRRLISVDWNGYLYDCDFNQMLDLPILSSRRQHIRDADADWLATRKIQTHNHCFGCTAGSGSSCQGSIH
jgi:radical SAM/Cys-rich protein